MVDLMGGPADEPERAEVSEERALDDDAQRRGIRDVEPYLRLEFEHPCAAGGRQPVIATCERERLLIPTRNAGLGVALQGEQPFGTDPDDVDQVPEVQGGGPPSAGPPHRVVDLRQRPGNPRRPAASGRRPPTAPRQPAPARRIGSSTSDSAPATRAGPLATTFTAATHSIAQSNPHSGQTGSSGRHRTSGW